MKTGLLLCGFALFSPALALAQSAQEQRDLERIGTSVQENQRSYQAGTTWDRVNQSKLDRSFVSSVPVHRSQVRALDVRQKCFPWGWEGGDRQRASIAVAAEVCLISNVDKSMAMDQMKTEIAANGDSQLFLFNQQFPFVQAHGVAQNPMVGNPSVNASLLVLGNQVWSDNYSAPEVNWAKSFRFINLDEKRSQVFMLGPVPLTVTVGVRGPIGAKFSARLAVGNGTVMAIPSAEIGGYAFGGVDVAIVKGGVEGNFRVLDETLTLKGQAGLVLDPTTFPPQLIYAAEASGYNDLAALNGGVDLVAKTAYPIPGMGDTFRYPVMGWPGFKGSGYVFNEKIGPAPVRF